MAKEEETLPEYTEPVEIKVGNWVFGWHPESDVLYPGRNEDVVSLVESIEDLIHASSVGGQIAVTPEGPFLKGSVSDLAAVIWATNFLYGSEYRIEVISGEAPTMEDLGLDLASSYDETGNEIIR
jgi:hypothetical protein